MKNIQKYDCMIKRLRAGETVRCEECGKGFYRPSNPASDINHWYICDNCGAHVHWDPVVEVE